jgi:hypothetical protein
VCFEDPDPHYWSAGSGLAKIAENINQLTKGTGHILVFIRNAANFAHFFREMSMMQK